MDNYSNAEKLYAEALNIDVPGGFRPGKYLPDAGMAVFTFAGNKGVQLVKKAAELGYAEAQYQVALFYWFEKRNDNASLDERNQQALYGLTLLKRAAEQNHGEACLVLGDYYSEFYSCLGNCPSDIDNSKSFFYYQKGASAGCVDAMERLARCYYHGRGVAEDNDKAFTWFSKACQAGHEDVWYTLGECYLGGYGTKQDIPKAITAFEKALNGKWSEESKYRLAFIYQGGQGGDAFRYADFDKSANYANSVSPNSEVYSQAQQLLTAMPIAESEHRKWKDEQAASNNRNNTSSNTSGGCYVATAVYGSYDCPQVWTLRRFRDYTLADTWYGRLFIHTYYAVSPTLVKWFGNTHWFKSMFKGPLDRLVERLQRNGIDSSPYHDLEW